LETKGSLLDTDALLLFQSTTGNTTQTIGTQVTGELCWRRYCGNIDNDACTALFTSSIIESFTGTVRIHCFTASAAKLHTVTTFASQRQCSTRYVKTITVNAYVLSSRRSSLSSQDRRPVSAGRASKQSADEVRRSDFYLVFAKNKRQHETKHKNNKWLPWVTKFELIRKFFRTAEFFFDEFIIIIIVTWFI